MNTPTSREFVPADPWLRIEDVARVALCSPATVRRAIQAKQLAAIRLNGGRRYRVRASAVDRWLETFAATEG